MGNELQRPYNKPQYNKAENNYRLKRTYAGSLVTPMELFVISARSDGMTTDYGGIYYVNGRSFGTFSEK